MRWHMEGVHNMGGRVGGTWQVGALGTGGRLGETRQVEASHTMCVGGWEGCGRSGVTHDVPIGRDVAGPGVAHDEGGRLGETWHVWASQTTRVGRLGGTWQVRGIANNVSGGLGGMWHVRGVAHDVGGRLRGTWQVGGITYDVGRRFGRTWQVGGVANNVDGGTWQVRGVADDVGGGLGGTWHIRGVAHDDFGRRGTSEASETTWAGGYVARLERRGRRFWAAIRRVGLGRGRAWSARVVKPNGQGGLTWFCYCGRKRRGWAGLVRRGRSGASQTTWVAG